MQSAYAERKKRAWEDTVVLDLSRTRKLILMKPNFISREIEKNVLRKKVLNLHTAVVCRVSKHFGESDTGQRKLRWNKEVWQQETNSVFFVVSEKKSILGRYINTLFFLLQKTQMIPSF